LRFGRSANCTVPGVILKLHGVLDFVCFCRASRKKGIALNWLLLEVKWLLLKKGKVTYEGQIFKYR
jgi:hypothetical protein